MYSRKKFFIRNCSWIVLMGISSLLLSFSLSFGANVVKGMGNRIDSLQVLFFQFFTLIPFVFIILYAISNCLQKLSLSHNRASKIINKYILPRFSIRSILWFSLLIMVLWLIWLIALFPGAMNWDTYYQINMSYPDVHPIASDWDTSHQYMAEELSDHHPIFDTFVFSLFARVSHIIFGTWNYGVFLFVVIQSCILAICIATLLGYLNKIHINVYIRLVSFIFLVFFPVIPAYSATMLKDSFFAVCYVPYFILMFELVRTKGEIVDNRRFIFAWLVSGLLVSLTKKTGLYLVIPTAIGFAIIYRSHWKRILVQVLPPILILLVAYPLIIFPLFDVAPGGKQEALGVLFQQTARYVSTYPNEVTDEEREVIDKLLTYDTLASRYDADTNDPVKNLYNYRSDNQDLLAYIKVWISQGIRHPVTYFSATFGVCARFFSPGGKLTILTHTGDVEHYGSSLIWQPHEFDQIRAFVEKSYDVLSNTPIISIFFEASLYSIWVPVLFLVQVIRIRNGMLPLFLPVSLMMITLIISPIYDTRYLLPMIIVAPLLVSAMVYSNSVKLMK